MPRTFTVSTQYRVGVDDVFAAFADQRYWLERLADSGADAATLDSMTIATDGGINVTTTQCIHHSRLPGLAAQFHSGDLELVRSEKWSAIRSGASHAEVTGRVLRAPAKLTGEAVLEPADAGCILRFSGTVQVDIPLVGGRIESFVGAQLAELMTA
ncbi:MAG TPA: DUF2505 domain-containing protein, partial [Mycobacterium sp.]|nr:DUF2505 domain-containing protein [Mycobacterium sp.]